MIRSDYSVGDKYW